jgi:3-hydroxybutyryl-CoA dehydrogenase
MGSGLAEVAARAGYSVMVRSRTQMGADELVAAVAKSLDRHVKKATMSTDERDEILSRIVTTTDIAKVAMSDLVIESIVEDLATKRQLFAELGAQAPEHTILATNTSTLPVVEMAMASGRPDRVCGIHFFNPAPLMRLVEVIRPITASDATITAAHEFTDACGKDAIDVVDRAGFVVNALLFPYLNRAVRMLEQQTASMEAIDTGMKGGCNFPMGPFELLDLVGLDTSVSILEALHAETRDQGDSPAPTLRRLVEAGHLGRKTGRGFYDYAKK